MLRNFIAIYTITNIINHKVYIGQSTQPYKRYLRHSKYPQYTGKQLGQDIIEYGKDNFQFNILEWVEDFGLEQEQYYIDQFKKKNIILYNKSKGGENPPHKNRDISSCATYSEKQLLKTIDLLKNTFLSQTEIAKRIKTSIDFVYKVNIGYNKPKEHVIIYPIRKENYFDVISKKIIKDLQETDLTQKQIAKKYKIARSTVTMINTGDNHYNPEFDYPIRKPNIPKNISIRKELKNNQLTYKEIAEKFEVSLNHVYQIRKQLKETCND